MIEPYDLSNLENKLPYQIQEFYREGQERFARARKIAAELDSIELQLKFWIKEKHDFLSSLTMYQLGLSGHAETFLKTKGELFYDRLVSNEIERLLALSKIDETRDDQEDIPVPHETKQRVAWCYAVGIIDYLLHNKKINSTNGVASVLRLGMGIDIKTNTIQKYISKLRDDPNELEKFKNYIDAKCSELKIDRVH
jgi:hypothetical protein